MIEIIYLLYIKYFPFLGSIDLGISQKFLRIIVGHVCLATRSVSREAVTSSREVGYCLDRPGHTSTSWNKGPGHSLTMANVALIFETPLSSVFNALDVSTGSRGDNSLSILVTAFPPPLIPALSQPDTCLTSVRRSTSKFSFELLSASSLISSLELDHSLIKKNTS